MVFLWVKIMIGNVVDKLTGSLLPKEKEQMSLYSRAIGNIKLDVTTSEVHGSSLSITANPIEDGSVIADHAVLEPKEVTITGVVVDYEPKESYLLVNTMSSLVRGNVNFLDAVGTMVEISNKTGMTKEKIIKEGLDYVEIELGIPIRKIASHIPVFSEILNKYAADSTQDERVTKIYSELLGAQKSGAPIIVKTGLCTYNNMLISGIGVTQDMDGSAEFSITLREVFIVETQTIDGVEVPEKKKTSPSSKKANKKSGRACEQGAPKDMKGKTEPKKQQRSVIRKNKPIEGTFDIVTGILK